MKKLLSILTATIMILSCGILTSAETVYPFGYYLDKVEYINDNVFRATVVFSEVSQNDTDLTFTGLLAVYDKKSGKFINVSIEEYSHTTPFLTEESFSVTQYITVSDITLDEYEFKFMVWENSDSLKPCASSTFCTDTLTKNDISDSNVHLIKGKITNFPFDTNNNIINVTVTSTNSKQIFEAEQNVYLKNEKNINIEKYIGLTCNIEIYNDIENGSYVLNNISIAENNTLTINPLLYNGVTDKYISYYKAENSSNPDTSSRVEAPFTVYINLAKHKTIAEEYLNSYLSDYALSAYEKLSTNATEFKFTDTDNNGLYDTLFITEEATMIVNMIFEEEHAISASTTPNVFSSTASMAPSENLFLPLDLNTDSGNVSYCIKDTSNNELTFEDIETGDILTVKKSEKSYEYYHYDITVLKPQATEGIITEVRIKRLKDENGGSVGIYYYIINGTEYRTYGDRATGMIFEAGTTISFLLSENNEIISYEIIKTEKHGILISIENEFGTKNALTAKIMTTDGTVKDFKFTTSTHINYSDLTNTSEINVIPYYSISGDTTSPVSYYTINTETVYPGTIIMYKLNELNKISYLYTTETAMKNKYSKIEIDNFSEQYLDERGRIQRKYVTDDTKILCVSDGFVTDENRYFTYTKENLDTTTEYNGTMLYNSSTEEIEVLFITNLTSPADTDIKQYTSTQMTVSDTDNVSTENTSRNRKNITIITDNEYIIEE